jgi:hypothetical protein
MEIKKLQRDEKFATPSWRVGARGAFAAAFNELSLSPSAALHMKDKHAGADDVRAIKRTGQTI